ncbi:hypothetical protein EMIHUDRAFT_243656 [Emiliania huxleyi CCMP1516]|uniref:Uncharacterized protein n=2 Tax=Emiliania huxleyi TaxID=2903 RepID=A0A0D3J525_EMIH1|nr:hypothetical protein EMIHUDRAFT_212476 [Emiliania huxleyi CCMP1516]XP_005771039.1 hypothetical protein EMIHUDRAFT_243656 [Emiliania huxleyi CCMP1516]EOD13905.1 hypothetical protein EMIHUDRAFT_212476 [Emiliania huxleyi CCMP1516]EOD18610.1 hypothetical protein EMIHUDRAFT_243656 [Emiliania huxleyi CCMP1516]|eukprot:XP_005766334.1 hypothetical protein EMIHUDRAFT_212476 [Emiliania huxleyi CCMP1516]
MTANPPTNLPSHLKRVVIDNGGHTCKVGFAGQSDPERCLLNGVVKTKGPTGKVYVGDQYEACPDYSSLQYRLSLERGCLVNWDTQAEVWSRALGADVLAVNPADCSLLLSEIPMCPTSIQASQRAPEASAAPPMPASLVVDAGFSATHVVPIFGSAALNYGIKRLGLGGKLLTNHLKQVISYRAYNVPKSTAPERLCYVSLDFDADLALTRFRGKKNTIRREFVMPDYKKGRVPADRAEEQALSLSNERITVPELLFHPSDIGLEQAGLPECIVQAAEACPPDMREALYANILVTGGSSRFPNFEERLQRELRALVPSDLPIGFTAASDPTLAAWRGGSIFAAAAEYDSAVVTKEQYREEGHALCRRRFAGA